MISRRRRTEALVESDPSVARGLAELVERASEVREVVPARQGLVMCQVRETARNSRFYLGEALMTECRVRIGDVEGLGAALGGDAALAHDLAVVDAALSGADLCADVVAELERGILAAERRVADERARAAARTCVSRVSFDEMGGQDMSVQAVVK